MTVSTAKTLRIIAIFAALILAIWLIGDVSLAIFLAVLVAVVLRGLSRFVSPHTGLPQRVALILVVLMLGVVLLGLGYRIAPTLYLQTRQLSRELHRQLEMLQLPQSSAPWQEWLKTLPSSTGLSGRFAASAGAVLTVTGHTVIFFFVSLIAANMVQLFAPAYRPPGARNLPRRRPHLVDVGGGPIY